MIGCRTAGCLDHRGQGEHRVVAIGQQRLGIDRLELGLCRNAARLGLRSFGIELQQAGRGDARGAAACATARFRRGTGIAGPDQTGRTGVGVEVTFRLFKLALGFLQLIANEFAGVG